MRLTALLPATASLLLSLASCAVYIPTTPPTPMVRAAGQTDLSVGLYQPGHLEASAVYSPVAHVLLTGMAAGIPRLSGETGSAQYEVGAGLYQTLGERWVLSGVGGFGQAHSRRATSLYGVTLLVYEADYHKAFGQVSIAHTSGDASYGLTYRLTNVTFSDLRFSELLSTTDGVVPLRSMLRHEVAATLRVPFSPGSRWQGNGSLGLSVTNNYNYNDNLVAGYGYTHVDAQKSSTLLLGVGVTYQLGKR